MSQSDQQDQRDSEGVEDLRVGGGSGVSPTLFSVMGVCLGVVLGHGLWSAVSGGALGFLFGSWRSARNENETIRLALRRLEVRHAALDLRVRGETVSPSPSPSPSPEADAPDVTATLAESVVEAPAQNEPVREAEVATLEEAVESGDRAVASDVDDGTGDSIEDAVAAAFAQRREQAVGSGAKPAAVAASHTLPPAPAAPVAPPPGHVSDLIHRVFFGGNTVVRVGLLVLLVGITLLAKYAVDNSLFPVEARLGAAALMGLGLVSLGFRQREARPGFGMSLQGGGIAALYLVTFFAYRVYELVPSSLAFTIFVGLALGTAALSILQKSQPLLIIGTLGGFLAPILASTGSNNYVALFSYYLLLNGAIAAVALKQDWRLPARLAFLCTYGVATAWGVLRYKPELFSTTEPFVLAFGVLFTFIATALAFRRPESPRGSVDATLVFGTPFVTILLQAALVREMEMGLALSAGGFGIFYALLATYVWRIGSASLRPLAECYVALAVGFATMAIPFAFDEAFTTSVAWAFEGAGLYWVGVRQNRPLSRFAGVFLQALAAMAFFASAEFDRIDPAAFLPLANGRALSCLALAFAGALIARQAFVAEESVGESEKRMTQVLGLWALLWWAGGGIAEIDQFVAKDGRATALLLFIAGSALALEWLAARLRWDFGRFLALLALPAAFMIVPISFDFVDHLFAHGGWFAWPLLFVALHVLWQRMQSEPEEWVPAFRTGSIWLAAVVASIAAFGLVEATDLTTDWQAAAFGVGLAVVILVSLLQFARGASPFDLEPRQALVFGVGPIAMASLLTIFGMQLAARGDASPLPHMPLLNPIDLTVWLLVISVFAWWRQVRAQSETGIRAGAQGLGVLGISALAFVWLNGILVRAVHQWAGIPFDGDDLWRSTEMQVTLSIAWTLVGLIGMLVSSRFRIRPLWMGCAALLGLVVVKLFVIDLSQMSTVARIFTFLVVGVLLLVLGYLSPVPPTEDAAPEQTPLDENEAAPGRSA